MKVPILRAGKLSPDNKKHSATIQIVTNDNKKCSASIKNVTHDNNSHLKFHPQNKIVPEHQDMLEGPPKKTIKLTSNKHIYQRVKRSAKPTVTFESAVKESGDGILISISWKIVDDTQ